MTTLPPLNIRYPFDPTGDDPGNLVRDERHTLPPVHNRIIVPKLGAYYANSLIVKQQGKILVKDKDYELAALYHDATVAVGQDVNIMIYFTNMEIDGDIEITYQVVGGEFTGVWEAIQQYVNVLLVDPRKVRWDDILHKPELYAPLDHFHDINDIYGLNHLVPKLEEIRQAVMRVRSREMRKVYDLIFKIKRDTEDAIKEASETIINNVRNQINNTEELNEIRQTVATLRTKVEALESNTEVQTALRELREKDNTLQNRISALEDGRATKEELTAKYNELLREINTLKQGDFLTYSKISELPEKHWEKGTSLLARKSTGEYFRLVTDESLFQDVGVAITANKTVSQEGDAFIVKVTVTNSQVAKNDMTELLINFPRQDIRVNVTNSYTLDQFTTTLDGGDRIEQINNETYRIYGLQRGGTAIVSFRLTTTTFGSFQIGAQVSVNTEYDIGKENNTSSIILKSLEKPKLVDANYVATKDCPAIRAFLVEGNKPLKLAQTEKTIYQGGEYFHPAIHHTLDSAINDMNLFDDRDTLRGLQIRLENVSTLYLMGENYVGGSPGYLSSANPIMLDVFDGIDTFYYLPYRISGLNATYNVGGLDYTGTNYTSTQLPILETIYGKDLKDANFQKITAYTNLYYLNSNSPINNNPLSNKYTFINNILTITGDITRATILFKPNGMSCTYQLMTLGIKKPFISVAPLAFTNIEIVNNLNGDVIEVFTSSKIINYKDQQIIILDRVEYSKSDKIYAAYPDYNQVVKYNNNGNFNIAEVKTIKLNLNKDYDFDIVSNVDFKSNYFTSGRISISKKSSKIYNVKIDRSFTSNDLPILNNFDPNIKFVIQFVDDAIEVTSKFTNTDLVITMEDLLEAASGG